MITLEISGSSVGLDPQVFVKYPFIIILVLFVYSWNYISRDFRTPGKVMCADVINNVNDLDEARAIFFVLKSAQHLNLVFNIVQVSIPPPHIIQCEYCE